MPEQETFENIYLDLSRTAGRCRFAKTGMGWKPAGGQTWTLNSSDISASVCHWSRAARGYELKMYTKAHGIVQLDGFEPQVSLFFPFKHDTAGGYLIDSLMDG